MAEAAEPEAAELPPRHMLAWSSSEEGVVSRLLRPFLSTRPLRDLGVCGREFRLYGHYFRSIMLVRDPDLPLINENSVLSERPVGFMTLHDDAPTLLQRARRQQIDQHSCKDRLLGLLTRQQALEEIEVTEGYLLPFVVRACQMGALASLHTLSLHHAEIHDEDVKPLTELVHNGRLASLRAFRIAIDEDAISLEAFRSLLHVLVERLGPDLGTLDVLFTGDISRFYAGFVVTPLENGEFPALRVLVLAGLYDDQWERVASALQRGRSPELRVLAHVGGISEATCGHMATALGGRPLLTSLSVKRQEQFVDVLLGPMCLPNGPRLTCLWLDGVGLGERAADVLNAAFQSGRLVGLTNLVLRSSFRHIRAGDVVLGAIHAGMCQQLSWLNLALTSGRPNPAVPLTAEQGQLLIGASNAGFLRSLKHLDLRGQYANDRAIAGNIMNAIRTNSRQCKVDWP
jgi:hypothetical protein